MKGMNGQEEWAEEVRKNLIPLLVEAIMKGNTAALRGWFGEGVYGKVSAEIRARKQDGIVFDSNILAVDENTLLLRLTDNGVPVIVTIYTVQQINCVRNNKGEIIEVRS